MFGKLGGGGSMKMVAKKMLDSQMGDVLVSLVTKQERALVEQVSRIYEELGLDAPVVPEREERDDQVRDGLRIMVGSADAPDVWMDHVGEERLEEPERARDRFLDLSGEEWRSECEKIVRGYRQQGIEEWSRSAIVAHYVRDKFGVSTREFVANVVNWPEARKQATVRAFVFGQLEGLEGDLALLADLAETGDLVLDEEVTL